MRNAVIHMPSLRLIHDIDAPERNLSSSERLDQLHSICDGSTNIHGLSADCIKVFFSVEAEHEGRAGRLS